jgi:hypothetical protein
MNTGAVTPRTAALAAYIEQMAKRFEESPDFLGDKQKDMLLYLGNWHDTVPRLLLYDPLLNSNDKVVWITHKTCSDPRMATAAPDAGWVAEQLKIARNSAMWSTQMLRVTRWLSLCARIKIRDDKGQFSGYKHIHALHDEPVTLADALYLDPGYIDFLRGLQSHSYSRLSQAACRVLAAIQEDIEAGKDTLAATTLPRVEARLVAQQEIGMIEASDTGSVVADPFFSSRFTAAQILSTGSEITAAQILSTGSEITAAQILSCGESSSCSSYIYKKTTTTTTDGYIKPPRARADLPADLVFPPALSPQEQQLALIPLERITPDVRQDVLDQLAWRITDGKASGNLVRNHLAYLAQLCNEVVAGTFVFSGGQRIREARERQRKEEAIEAKRKQGIAEEGQRMNGRLEQTDPRLAARIKGMQEKARRGGAPCAT